MKTILSIDWDYFIDATLDQRMEYFPDGGNEELPDYLLFQIWVNRYASSLIHHNKYPESYNLRNCSTDSDELNSLYGLLAECTFNKKGPGIIVAESHKAIAELIEDYDEPVNLINIDFHHDCFGVHKQDTSIDCGNWLQVLFQRGDIFRTTWVSRLDSQTSNCTGTIGIRRIIDTHITTIDDIRPCHLDAIFVCRSGTWSPPHLDDNFIEMVLKLNQIANLDSIVVEAQLNALCIRWSEQMDDMIKSYAATQLSMLENMRGELNA